MIEIPHPREASALFGHDAALARFAAARNGRLHHAWLLYGGKGVGAATLAFGLARALVAGDPQTALLDPAHPVSRRVAAGSEPNLYTLERPRDEKTGRLKTAITVEQVRVLKDKLALAAPDQGWRAVVIDAAEDMNRSAANALLKLLEEPPARVTFFLVSHDREALAPTILSRTAKLPLGAALDHPVFEAVLNHIAPQLEEAERQALWSLAEGSPGEALHLATEGGVAAYREIIAFLSHLPGPLDRAALHKHAEAVAGRDGESAFEVRLRLMTHLLRRLYRASATRMLPADGAPEDGHLLNTLAAPHAALDWVEAERRLLDRARKTRMLNLDRRQMFFDMYLDVELTARRIAAGGPYAR